MKNCNCLIVTCFNNPTLLEQMSSTVHSHQINVNILALDNTSGRYSSSAQAYNHTLKNLPDCDVLIFCHQDILFLEGAIDSICHFCTKNPNVLYGAAGVNNTGHHGGSGRIVSAMACPQEGCNYSTLSMGAETDVFSLDECLIAGSHELFRDLSFDENVCNGFHLYAVDLSLACHLKKIPVRVFGINIVHLSGGNQDKTFYESERKLAKKYRGFSRKLSYTCGWTYTSFLGYWGLRLYRKLRFSLC